MKRNIEKFTPTSIAVFVVLTCFWVAGYPNILLAQNPTDLWIPPPGATGNIGSFAVGDGEEFFTFPIPASFLGFDEAAVAVIGTRDGVASYDGDLSIAQNGGRHDAFTQPITGSAVFTKDHLLLIDVSQAFPPTLFAGQDFVGLRFRVGGTSPNKPNARILGLVFKFQATGPAPPETSAFVLWDSGCFPVGINSDYVFTHGLGTTIVLGSVWFSKSSNCAGNRYYGPAPFSWRDHNPEYDVGVAVAEMTNSTVTIRTGNRFDIPGAVPGPDNSEHISSGFVRVVLLAPAQYVCVFTEAPSTWEASRGASRFV